MCGQVPRLDQLMWHSGRAAQLYSVHCATVQLCSSDTAVAEWQSGATQLGAPGAAGSREAGKVRKEIHKYTNRRK